MDIRQGAITVYDKSLLISDGIVIYNLLRWFLSSVPSLLTSRTTLGSSGERSRYDDWLVDNENEVKDVKYDENEVNDIKYDEGGFTIV